MVRSWPKPPECSDASGDVTSAKNELYISYPKVASRAGPGGMMLTPSRFLEELPEGLYEELRIKRSYGW
jgi:DNA helicase-2/ATP-dependent DNA helicase PcrA